MRNSPAPIELSPEQFRALGHRTVDMLADHLAGLAAGRVTSGEEPPQVRAALGADPLPQRGEPADEVLSRAMSLLLPHSLYNGHPRFFGFITASAAPIGALADLIAGTINQNVGGWVLSPMATEIEAQTVRWIGELVGFPAASGLLVSGGNIANMVGLWAARTRALGTDARARGLRGERLRVYVSGETHTWIQKAADLSGLGTDAIRWIATDSAQRMDVAALRAQLAADLAAGQRPLAVVGTAGSTSTGAIDPLGEIASVCREHGLWFHVDGAYGAPAAALPGAPRELRALAEADSVAIDPHKWLYAPLEAGCTLVRDAEVLRDTFTYHPPYYPDALEDEAPPVYYHELGPQNSRGFRALKVWMALRQVGREGYVRMIGDDIALARAIFDAAAAHPQLEARTLGLSVFTLRYVPDELRGAGPAAREQLNALNKAVMLRLQTEGHVFVSNAVVDDDYLLRGCIVNFRTMASDVDRTIELVVAAGEAEWRAMRVEATA